MDTGFCAQRMIEVFAILALIVTVQVSTADAQTVKFTPANGTPANGEQLTVAEALDGRVTIDFDEVALDDAVDAWKAAVGIEIQFSVDVIDETGVGEDDPKRSLNDRVRIRVTRPINHQVLRRRRSFAAAWFRSPTAAPVD